MTKGTSSRDGIWVRGVCQACGSKDRMLYEAAELLVCPECYRTWSQAHPVTQACDDCGSTGNVWRDPVSRKNEYFCATCHGKRGKVFTNRWSTYARQSKGLGIRQKVECAVADGTCKGEVRWRSEAKTSLCNRHAGKEGSGPNG